MTPSIAIAEAVRKTTDTATDYAVAKALGISQSNLKQVLAGKRSLGIEALFRAAALLDKTERELFAEVQFHSAKTPEKKAFWEKYRPRLLPAVAIWGCIAGVMGFTVPKAEASNYLVTKNIHYAHRRWMRIQFPRFRFAI